MLVQRSDVATRSVFDVWPCTSEREININNIKNGGRKEFSNLSLVLFVNNRIYINDMNLLTSLADA